MVNNYQWEQIEIGGHAKIQMERGIWPSKGGELFVPQASTLIFFCGMTSLA